MKTLMLYVLDKNYIERKRRSRRFCTCLQTMLKMPFNSTVTGHNAVVKSQCGFALASKGDATKILFGSFQARSKDSTATSKNNRPSDATIVLLYSSCAFRRTREDSQLQYVWISFSLLPKIFAMIPFKDIGNTWPVIDPFHQHP